MSAPDRLSPAQARAKMEGKPIPDAPAEGRAESNGVVSARKIELGLGWGGPESLKKPVTEDAPTKALSPAQARAREEGKPVPPDPPGVTQTVVAGGRDVWELLGRPAPNVTVPLGQGEEGKPLPKEELSFAQAEELRERRARERGELPQRVDWDRIDNAQDRHKLKKQLARIERAINRIGGGK